MKKRYIQVLLAAFAVMLLSVSVLVGCGSGGAAPESLEGTKWEITTISGGGQTMDFKEYAKQAGVSDSMYVEFKNGKAIEPFDGTSADYTYENGKLIIDGREVSLNGNTMTIEANNFTMTLVKK